MARRQEVLGVVCAMAIDDDPAPGLAAAAQRKRRQRRQPKAAVSLLRWGGEARSLTQRVGSQAESRALAKLERAGLVLEASNVAGRRGELDLVMWDRVVLVFIEVRSRRQHSHRYGDAVSSVGYAKQQRLTQTAARYLQVRFGSPDRWPVCRFDVLGEDGGQWIWVRGAFDSKIG